LTTFEANYVLKTLAEYLIANLAPIGTLLGVVISIAVLLEMRKQRSQSFQPQIFFQEQNIWLERNSDGTPCIMKTKPEPNEHFFGPAFLVKLENIGIGSAHSIEVLWSYDEKAMRKELSRLGKTTAKAENDYGSHFQYYFGEPSGLGYGFMIDEPPYERKSISFLKSGQSTELPIPESIKNYVTFMPYLRLIEAEFPRRIDFRLDQYKVLLRYQDLSGKTIKQVISVHIEIYAFGKDDLENNYAVGTIAFADPKRAGQLFKKKHRTLGLPSTEEALRDRMEVEEDKE
jgi:hypothetical protein